MEVPFVVSEAAPKKSKSAQKTVSTEKTQSKKDTVKKAPDAVETPPSAKPPQVSQEFRRALRVGDPDAALEARKKIDSPTSNDLSLLVETLVKAERLNEAKKVVLELIEQNQIPILRVFKFFLNKTAQAGDIETLDQISERLTPDQKRLVSFDNRYCHANIVSGRTEQYLAKLEADVENAKTPEEIQTVGARFPRGGAIGILAQAPEMSDRFLQVAEKYAAKQLLAPMNILWIQYFIDGKTDLAEQLWNKYLTNEPRLMFQRVSQVARERQDVDLAKRLIVKLKDAKITDGALGNAYSCLIDVLAIEEKFDEGLKVIKQAQETTGLENVNRTALNRIKDGVEKAGQNFPFVIPDKTKNATAPETSSSSSSSSSDDEVHQKTRKE